MPKFITKALATGIAKDYYKVEKEFEAVGTLFTTWDMFYVAAHPQKGLWLCGILMNNKPIIIGFVDWKNLDRIIIDDKNENVFIVVNNYDVIVKNASFDFRKMYKSVFSHTMNSGEKSFVLPKELFSGNIIPYLRGKCTIEYDEIEVKGSIFWTIITIVTVISIIVLFIIKIFELF